MPTFFNQPAVVQHQNAVGFLHGGQPVGDDQGGAPAHGGLQRGLHHAFAFGIKRAGGFVEQEQRRVFQHGPGDGDALALTARQAHAALAQKGVVVIRQRHDELVRKRRMRCRSDFIVAGVGAAVADVLERAGREHHRVLRHDADAPPQRLQVHLVGGHAVERDAAGLRVVKAQQQLKHRALAGTAGADDGDGFARRNLEREITERCLQRTRGVVKGQRLQRDGAAGLGGRHLERRGRRGNRRAASQQLHQALGGTGGAQQIAIHLAQHRKGARQNDHVDNSLAQVAGRDVATHHRLRALVQAPQQRA